MDTRIDHDTIGPVAVPVNALYSAQTQRSIENFPFGAGERQPEEIITALATVKEACAMANKASGRLERAIADAVIEAAREIRVGGDRESFPLVIFQTGSGTQSNMNMNEVIANKANVSLGAALGSKTPVHPNDHVNLSQSSNDVFPSAMSIAVGCAVHKTLLPALDELVAGLEGKVAEFDAVIKMGRTHMMDAVPMTLGQEFSAYVATLAMCRQHIANTVPFVCTLALGGTAVGTGLNSYVGFDEAAAKNVSLLTGIEFLTAPNKFMALSTVTPVVALNNAVVTLASALLKIANDVRLLASGPRAGLCELNLPANEPGSSIMPGKVNPTQCESLSMVCAQVVGSAQVATMCNTYGHLQLNVFLPLTASTVLRNIRLLAASMGSFYARCIKDATPNHKAIANHVQNSLMLCTALAPHIGYDNAAKIAKHAHNQDLTLKEAALQLGLMTAQDFDAKVVPADMVTLKNLD